MAGYATAAAIASSVTSRCKHSSSIVQHCAAAVCQACRDRCGCYAGREAAGKAFRLFTEASFNQLAATTLPEIQRVNLATVALQLKALGFDDLVGFDFMDRPPTAAMLRALETLYALGALDDSGNHICAATSVLLPYLCCCHTCVAATSLLLPHLCCCHICAAATSALLPHLCCCLDLWLQQYMLWDQLLQT